MTVHEKHHRAILESIARRAMLERGLLPDFSTEALAELGRIQAPAVVESAPNGTGHLVRDMRNLLWTRSLKMDQRLTNTPAITLPRFTLRPRSSLCCPK